MEKELNSQQCQIKNEDQKKVLVKDDEVKEMLSYFHEWCNENCIEHK